jgi:hypothetical protein
MLRLQYLTAFSAAESQLRTFEGREHLVVPVVALVEGVIFASNAEAPELVLAAELSKTVAGWNGRPAVLNHPRVDGQNISANHPRVLEQYGLGNVFEAAMQDNRLTMEAWLDLQKADRVAGGHELVERARRGDVIEVSVGVFVEAVEGRGTFKGESYSAVWKQVIPDHLALLEEGTIGACSVAMGCGTRVAAGQPRKFDGTWTDAQTGAFVEELSRVFASPSWQLSEEEQRALRSFFEEPGADVSSLPSVKAQTAATQVARKVARRFARAEERVMTRAERIRALLARKDVQRGNGSVTALLTMSDAELATLETAAGRGELGEQPTWWRKVLGIASPRSAVQLSDMDVRASLEEALRPEAGFLGVDAVYPDEEQVIYMVMTGERVRTYRRGYSIDSSGTASLSDDAEEVMITTSYQPLAAEAAEGGETSNRIEVRAAGCGCGGSRKKAAPAVEGDANMKTKTELVKALVASPKNPFSEADTKVLEQFSEERLTALVAADEAKPEEKKEPVTPAAPVVPAAPAAEPIVAKAKTTEEWLKDAPPELQRMVGASRKLEADRKATAIRSLKEAKQTAFTDAELEAMNADELDKLLKLSGLAATQETNFAPNGPSGSKLGEGAGEVDVTAPKPRSLQSWYKKDEKSA